MFIVLYGINNIGKSTQIQRLQEKFQAAGKTVKVMKYPVYDLLPTGPQINYFLRDPEAEKISGESLQMLYIQNRLDYEPQLVRDLKKYDIVLAEDYVGTGMAWGMTQNIPFPWIQSKHDQHRQKKADLEILLDGDRFLSGKEKNHRNESDDQAVQLTRKNFLFLAKRYHWPIVNANQEEEKVTEDLLKLILEQP